MMNFRILVLRPSLNDHYPAKTLKHRTHRKKVLRAKFPINPIFPLSQLHLIIYYTLFVNDFFEYTFLQIRDNGCSTFRGLIAIMTYRFIISHHMH
jgi:hypothetical protein